MPNPTFQKQANYIEPCPNTAFPKAEVAGTDIILHYDAHWKHPGTVTIKFLEVAAYRIGDPNDEGFFGGGKPGIFNDSMYTWTRFPDLEWGEFYEVLGFDWTAGLTGTNYEKDYFSESIALDGTNPIVMIPEAKPTQGFRHFVFFMKDGTFECVCKGWQAASTKSRATR